MGLASNIASSWAAGPDTADPSSRLSLWWFITASTLVWSAFFLVVFQWPQNLLPVILSLCLLLLLIPVHYGYLVVLTALPVNAIALFLGYDIKKNIHLPDIALLCLFATWLVRHLARRKYPYPGTNIDWLMGLFFLWSALSLIWGTDLPQGTWEFGRLALCLLAFFLTVALVKDREDFRRVAVVLILVGLVETALCMISLYDDKITFHKHYSFYGPLHFWNNLWRNSFFNPRASATDTPHNIGTFLCLPVFAGVGMFLVARTKAAKVLSLLASLIIMAGVTATLTKGAIGSLWLGLMYLCALLTRTKKQLITCLVVSVLVGLGLFAAVMCKDLYRASTGVAMNLDTSSERTSAGSRLKWWRQGMGKLMETGGIGYGIGGFRAAVKNHVPDGTHAAVFFDLGFIGMLLWGMLFVNCFITCWRRLRIERDQEQSLLLAVYLAGLVTIVVGWLVTLYYTYLNLWVYLGLGYALLNLKRPAALPAPAGAKKPLELKYQVSLATPLASWVLPPRRRPPGVPPSPALGLGTIPSRTPYPQAALPPEAGPLAWPPPVDLQRPRFPWAGGWQAWRRLAGPHAPTPGRAPVSGQGPAGAGREPKG